MTRLHEIARQSGPASAGLVLGGALWGILWVPIRMLEEMGLGGSWAGLILYFAAVILLVPILIVTRAQLLFHWRRLAICGLLTGAAISLYTTSLALTEVVRAVLFFYLSPIWSTLLGRAFLGERLSPARLVAIALGIGGLLAMLGSSGTMRGPNMGDAIALGSGICWAFGSFAVYRSGPLGISEQAFAFVFGAFLVTAATALVFAPGGGAVPDLAQLTSAMPLALIYGLLLVPTFFLTIWPATILSPARVGLLLMSEIIVGLVTAALWAGEVFGWHEAIGATMIVSAGFVEVLGHRPAQTA